MRSKQGLKFLIIALLCFCIHQSQQVSVETPEKMEAKVHDEKKFGHGTNSGGSSGDTNGGGSHSPYGRGGGGAIPVYAAGAQSNHHYHHSGVKHPHKTIIATTFAYIFLLSVCVIIDL
ncbi:hypothetical protein ACP275_06G086100 [Erythranthe tilingii]